MAAQRAQSAFRLYAARREHDKLFGPDGQGFGEPAWDMLLMLYVHDASLQPITREALIVAAGSAANVADRYLDWLVSRGLVATDQDDQTIVRMQPSGRDLMDRYLDAEAGRH